MPTYEFRCQACDVEFELFLKMSDPKPRKCKECGQLKLTQLLSASIGRVKGEPKELGQWAEANEKRLGREQIDRMLEEDRAKKKGWAGKSPTGGKFVERETSEGLPAHRSGEMGTEKLDKPLDLNKVKDINKYIWTGDKT